MTPDAIAWVFVLFCFVVVSALNARAAYRNGVTDGYGYSREPTCPGYAAAGEFLRAYMGHRWHELTDPCAVGKLQADIISLLVVAWPNLNPESRLLLADWLVWNGERFRSEGRAVDDNNRCRLPPSGWVCSQPTGHAGPCSCWPTSVIEPCGQ